jgi:S1-C subfamily serine protease
VPQLIKHGKPQQAGFGVQVVPDEVAQQNGITGVAILKVMPGTSAEKSGLVGLRETRDGVLLGDVIVGIDDAVIENYDDLYHVLNERKAGDVVTVKIRRDGAVRELRIELMNL